MSNEAFEFWAVGENFGLRYSPADKRYCDLSTQSAWEGYQARQPEIETLETEIELKSLALKGQHEAYEKEIARLNAEVERLRNAPDTAQKRFNSDLADFAERNWKVKKLLTDIGTYEQQNENIRSLIDKEFGVVEWVTYPVFQDTVEE